MAAETEAAAEAAPATDAVADAEPTTEPEPGTGTTLISPTRVRPHDAPTWLQIIEPAASRADGGPYRSGSTDDALVLRWPTEKEPSPSGLRLGGMFAVAVAIVAVMVAALGHAASAVIVLVAGLVIAAGLAFMLGGLRGITWLRVDRGWLEVSSSGGHLRAGRSSWNPRDLGVRVVRDSIRRLDVNFLEDEGYLLEATLDDGSTQRLLATPARDLANALAELIGRELEIPASQHVRELPG